MLKRLKVIIYIYIYERSKKNFMKKKKKRKGIVPDLNPTSQQLTLKLHEPMPIQSGESTKCWESTSTLNFSVTLVNHSILTMCTQTHLAISDLPSLPLKLFNSLPKKQKKKNSNECVEGHQLGAGIIPNTQRLGVRSPLSSHLPYSSPFS